MRTITTSNANSDEARCVLISVNPHAGAQNRQSIIDELARRLAARNLEPSIHTEIDAVAGLAERLQLAGQLRAVVAAGGDGTFRLVAERTRRGTPLTVMPLGTENLFARYLEQTADPASLATTITEGVRIELDAADANGRLFTLVAGCGFDAEVVRRLHENRRGHIHHLSYAKPILDAIRRYDYPELRVHYAPTDELMGSSAENTAGDKACKDLSRVITARWVFVVNLPQYAGGLNFAPRASGTDGLLDLCTFKSGSLWKGLVSLGGVMLGRHERMQDFSRVQTRRLRVEATAAVPYQLDGDPGGDLPLEISVLPRRLTLLVSRDWAERWNIGASRSLAKGDL